MNYNKRAKKVKNSVDINELIGFLKEDGKSLTELTKPNLIKLLKTALSDVEEKDSDYWRIAEGLNKKTEELVLSKHRKQNPLDLFSKETEKMSLMKADNKRLMELVEHSLKGQDCLLSLIKSSQLDGVK